MFEIRLIVSFCFSQSGDDGVKDDRKSLRLQDLKAGGEVSWTDHFHRQTLQHRYLQSVMFSRPFNSTWTVYISIQVTPQANEHWASVASVSVVCHSRHELALVGGFLVPLCEWWIQTNTTCWCEDLFPLMQVQEACTSCPMAEVCVVCSRAAFWSINSLVLCRWCWWCVSGP